MNNRVNRVTFHVTAESGKCDGYAELVIGILTLSDLLLSKPQLSRKIDGLKTIIKIETELKNPPLGHMGEADIEVKP